jgi:phage terminase large subunit-like protein
VFAERIIARYEGTRLGRQEIHGELLEDVEGALWNYDMIEPYRVQLMAPTLEDLIIPAAHIRLGELKRIVVGVDPAGGAKKANDETGIVVVGVDHRGHLYVLADYSGRYSPLGWAQRVDAAYDDFQCDAVVAETNYGGEMVSSNLRSAGVTKRVVTVHSRRGKAIRAEPIVGIYEQEKAHHAGVFTELEEEMTSWLPYEDRDSPNRLDALVHGATNLVSKPGVSDFASPTQLASTGQRMQQRSTAARQHHLHVPGRRATPWP